MNKIANKNNKSSKKKTRNNIGGNTGEAIAAKKYRFQQLNDVSYNEDYVLIKLS